jgi:predicted ester cyclase
VRLSAEDGVFVDVTQLEPAKGRKAYRAILAETFAGLPDFRPLTWLLMAQGERVAAELELSGSHLGLFLGYSATGAEIRWQASAFYTLNRSHDQIVSSTTYHDLASLTRRLAAASPLIQAIRRPEVSPG